MKSLRASVALCWGLYRAVHLQVSSTTTNPSPSEPQPLSLDKMPSKVSTSLREVMHDTYLNPCHV